MAVCKPPTPSSKVGQTSTSCLRKFTIHFRRPDTLNENSNYSYRGEYGFDWLRDEYIYPMEVVDVKRLDNHYYYGPKDTEPSYFNKAIPLCVNPDKLREEYRYYNDKKNKKNPFTPYGIDYYPAWLSIFACNVEGNAGSTMHQDGINLTLQLDEIDEIINDGTEIIFKPGKPCLKITPNKISISHFLKTPKKTRILDSDKGTPTINYYQLDSTVNIKCFGDTLKEHEEIRVFAKLGTTEVEVGKLMVYQNDNIGKAKIVVVNVITEYDEKGNKEYPQSYKSLDDLYNCQSFNQAMIRTEVILGEELDLVKLKGNSDVTDFLKDINNDTYLEGDNAENITARLCDLYDKYGKNLPKGGKVDGNKDLYTYLLFTAIRLPSATELGGASGRTARGGDWISDEKFQGGDLFCTFITGLNSEFTLVHEAGHSFSLVHTFSKNNRYVFHPGYTENYMDYDFALTFDSKKNIFFRNSKQQDVPHLKDNRYKDKMYSFYKWQWDFMFNDRSIEKKK